MKKKIISALLAIIAVMAFGNVSFAEDIHLFPPQIPQVGVMKVAVSQGGEIIMGLRTNGTVNIIGSLNDEAIEWVKTQSNIVDIACNTSALAVLDNTGSVKMKNLFTYGHLTQSPDWDNIAAIDCGAFHVVGLKNDGTVVAYGDNSKGQCSVNGWNNVSKIYANENFTIAIKKDGTIYAAGEISNYSDIAQLNNVI